ncbi:MAG TPA: hypothetical protein PLH72_07545 [Vicinamibacterales bacterium]|nr:hypothetical protein [Vicinamibacterales bacterium]
MTTVVGVLLLTQLLVAELADSRSAALELVECASSEALADQGLLATENDGAPDGLPPTAFLYRGSGSVNMFAPRLQPSAERCVSIGRATLQAKRVTARLPRECAPQETVVVSDLALIQLDRPISRATGVVIVRQSGVEIGRVIAASAGFALVSGAGAVTEKLLRGTVPADVREYLNGGGVQLVGDAPEGDEFVVADEAGVDGDTARVPVGSRTMRRRALAKFSLLTESCVP